MSGRADLDLRHAAQPSMLEGVRTRFVGNVLVNRCAEPGCGLAIWRTPERFVWSHGAPPRTARLVVVK